MSRWSGLNNQRIRNDLTVYNQQKVEICLGYLLQKDAGAMTTSNITNKLDTATIGMASLAHL